jgi:translation initiation factor eIF-2B subunit delta
VATVLSTRVEELRRDRTHGGSWLARRAVEALAELAEETEAAPEELVRRLVAAGRELASSASGIGAVAGAVGRLLATAHRQAHLDVDELRRLVRDEAEALVVGGRRASASIAIQLRDALTDAVVLTHSASATVREALLYTPPERVVCTASLPHGEGHAFADELREGGLAVELVEDEEAARELEWASLLLVGADTVFRNGTLCNKVGTRRLAEAAAEARVPMLVACESIKLAPFDPPPEAKLGPERDLTGPELIDSIVTEEGRCAGDEVRPLLDRTPFLLEGYALLRGSA